MAQDNAAALRAMQRDLQRYQGRTAKNLIAGLLLLGVGICLFFFAPNGAAPKAGWFYEAFGETGRIYAGKIAGAALALVAVWLLARVRRRMTVGVQAVEARARKVLNLPADMKLPQHSRTTLLAILLIVLVAGIALYWLADWYARTH